jgi:hypothetical protein
MRGPGVALVSSVALVFLSGCAVNLPFNHRLAYASVRDAKQMHRVGAQVIAIKWIPETFPERIDVQGASGVVGSASQTRIPTGVGLASRILEVLDAAIGVDDSSKAILTITVVEAKSEFEYSAGFLNVTPAIDVGRCFFEADFSLGDEKWRERFTAEAKDPTIGGTSQTGILERVWDDIALQVGRSVTRRLKVTSASRRLGQPELTDLRRWGATSTSP